MNVSVDIMGGIFSQDHAMYFKSVFSNPILLISPLDIPGHAAIKVGLLSNVVAQVDSTKAQLVYTAIDERLHGQGRTNRVMSTLVSFFCIPPHLAAVQETGSHFPRMS